MSEFVSAGPDTTRAAGAVVAGVLRAGDVVLLVGGLGAGKTTLVQGLVAALGAKAPVTSPTFTLAHRYTTTPRVTHVDLWRLEHLQEVVDLALEEELEDGAACLVEWGEAAEALYGKDCLVVRLAWGEGESERLISFETRGKSWQDRGEDLSERLFAELGSKSDQAGPR
jgi:tRNA threonylcarbamoyladenosine biosynthesis protein TsaE